MRSLFYLCLSLCVCLSQRCGHSTNSTRIVGGQPSNFRSWPWMALLRIIETDGSVSRCGATIITEEWILTAAHCLQASPSSRIKKVEVILGEHDTHKKEGSELKLKGTQIRLNNFDDLTNTNDIALVKLSQRLDFRGRNKNLQPICLLSGESGVDPNRCFGTGWGATVDDGDSSSVLREVRLPILHNSFCQSRWGREFDPKHQLCAGYKKGGRDTCQGDSGGPLSCQLANGVWIQEGITSFGGRCGSSQTPGVYTRVSSFLPWIERVTRVKF